MGHLLIRYFSCMFKQYFIFYKHPASQLPSKRPQWVAEPRWRDGVAAWKRDASWTRTLSGISKHDNSASRCWDTTDADDERSPGQPVHGAERPPRPDSPISSTLWVTADGASSFWSGADEIRNTKRRRNSKSNHICSVSTGGNKRIKASVLLFLFIFQILSYLEEL